ncbi:hypothetical protein QZH41_000891 [Actinostola sp. cb2023]|nr:hypothetical protein QZH41_000891 [Actinostola sp. cb2023]
MKSVTPIITMTSHNPVVVEGSNLNLTCNVSGTTPLNVKWTRSGKPDVQGMVYYITNIKRSDEGVYRCTVNNGAECPERSATTNATVKYPPSIVLSPQNVTLVEGQHLMLFCNASGHPAPNITWSKVGGNTVGHGDTFTIGSVVRGHEGSYRCVVNNGVECNTDSALTYVTVNYPPNITSPHSNFTVKEGQNVQLVCTAIGQPTPNINWTRDGVVVHAGSPFLTPNLTHNDDNACYTCIAYNGVPDAKTANLFLNVQ